MSIHPTAVVDSSAKIGKDVKIGPFVTIGPDVVIGDGCQIISHAVIEYTRLGKSCVVFPFVSLGLDPQHLQYKGEKTILEVGDRTVFRESVTAHRGTALDKSVTKIGSDCFLMAYSHIAHDCIIGDKVIVANGAQLAGHVQVGNYCFISTTVGIHQFVRIGDYALVSGGAMVPTDVAPFCMAQGDRASLKGLNLVGMRRGGVDRNSVKLIKKAYQAVFSKKQSLEEALKDPDVLVDNPHVENFRKFLSVPKRGILRPDPKEVKEPEGAAV